MGIRSGLVAAIRNGVAVARMEFDAGLAQHNAEYELRQLKARRQQLDARITGDYIPPVPTTTSTTTAVPETTTTTTTEVVEGAE